MRRLAAPLLALALISPAAAQTLGSGNLSAGSVTATGSATARNLANRAADIYNVRDNGAVGDCVTDDAPAINTLLARVGAGLTSPAAVYFPRAPGGCYLIASALAIPAPISNWSLLHLRGDGATVSTIRASATMTAVFQSSATFSQGVEISDLTADANGHAAYAVNVTNGLYRIHDIRALNATTADVRIDYSSSLTDSELRNYDTIFTTAGAMPLYNLYVTGDDCTFQNNYFINAKTANVEDINSADNLYLGNHAYNYSGTIAAGTYGTYNFETHGGRFIGNMADSSITAGFHLTGFNPILVGNQVEWGAGWTATVGILIDAGVQNTLVTNNSISGTTLANGVVQTGSPGVNSIVANNAGSLYGAQGPILSGVGNTNTTTILGDIGSSNKMQGTNTFGIGNLIYDQFRIGGLFQANGSNGGFGGDAQRYQGVHRGKGTSGTVDILADGGATRFNTNTIIPQVLVNIPSVVSAHIDLTANCSTGDVARWTTDFTFKSPGTVGTIVFVDAAGANNAPAWTTLSATAGAAAWTPAIVLDQTVRGAVIQGGGSACTGGKTVYWVARVDTTEAAAGTN